MKRGNSCSPYLKRRGSAAGRGPSLHHCPQGGQRLTEALANCRTLLSIRSLFCAFVFLSQSHRCKCIYCAQARAPRRMEYSTCSLKVHRRCLEAEKNLPFKYVTPKQLIICFIKCHFLPKTEPLHFKTTDWKYLFLYLMNKKWSPHHCLHQPLPDG